MILSCILIFALTRAEIIERFKAPVAIKANGLVQVVADCPKDMRREFQMDVATFASDICKRLEALEKLNSPKFAEPGIVIYIGEERTNRTDVVTLRKKRRDGTAFTRIYLPAPGFSDVERFRLEVVKAFYLAAFSREIDDDGARQALIDSDLDLKVDDEYNRLAKWIAGDARPADGESPEQFDERHLKLARSVIKPGLARTCDVLHFASRLRFYPTAFDVPYCGRYRSCTFRDAVSLAERDPRIRLQAFEKAPFVVAFGGGRGAALADAAKAYSDFLFDLAKFVKPREELLEELDAADALLAAAFDEARLAESGGGGRFGRQQ